MEQIRAAAKQDDVSLKKFVHAAVMQRASMHKRRVAEAARVVAERSAELNRRLA
ncbi:antitoxin Phd [Mycobacterium sp. GA-2829]|nr:antitoxin Phd [Mycobacterium sp. GA-2829]